MHLNGIKLQNIILFRYSLETVTLFKLDLSRIDIQYKLIAITIVFINNSLITEYSYKENIAFKELSSNLYGLFPTN